MLTIPVYYLNMLDHKYLQQNLSWSHNRGRKAKKALPAAGLYSCHPTSCCAACVLCGYWLPACNGRGGAHGDVNMSLASLMGFENISQPSFRREQLQQGFYLDD